MVNARKIINGSRKYLSGCRQCTKAMREECLDDDAICPYINGSDGLPLRCVGKWGGEKVYYLLQYFQMFATAMKDLWKGNLNYLEVCSGPGMCCTRDKVEQYGTSVAILRNPCFKYLRSALFFDYSSRVVETLNRRIKNFGASSVAKAIVGDYEVPESITKSIRKYCARGLTLCLIDPTDCSVPFETVKAIYCAANKKCDFIVSFFEQMDFNRNGKDAALKENFAESKDKYLRFLGDAHFFEREDVRLFALAGKNKELSGLFRDAYVAQMKSIGLKYHSWITIGNYYRLLFVSGDSRGVEFWQKSSEVDPQGVVQLGLGL